jgi:sugar phosphate permease
MQKAITYPGGFSHRPLQAWAVVSCAALFFGYQFILRVTPNVISEDLMQILMIDATELGFILAYYNWAYAGMQLPLGVMMDRIGPRVFIGAGALTCSIACYLFSIVETVEMASIARFLIGLGSACGFIGTLKLGTLWFEPKDMGKVIALTYTLGTIGATLGGAPLRLLYEYVGFCTMMQILGILGFFISVLVFLIVHNHPHGKQHTDALKIYENKHPIHDLWFVVKNPQSWCIALYSMLMYAPIAIVGDAWGVQFLEKACGLEDIVAPLVISVMFFGAAIGSPLSATLSDLIQNRRLPMIVGAVVTLVIYLVIILVKDLSLYALYALFFMAGLAYAAKGIGFAVICEIMPRRISGVSIAFVNTAVMLAGTIFYPLIGFLVHLHWDGTLVACSPLYTGDNYRFAFIAIPVISFMSIFLVLLMKESHPARSIVKKYGHTIDPEVL